MAKLTSKPIPGANESNIIRTENEAGGAAYTMPLKARLVHRTMACLFKEPAFYGDKTDQLVEDAASLCRAGNGSFVLKTAVYARRVMNLRTVPVALLGIYALTVKIGPHAEFEKAVLAVCTRPDQLQELVGFINQYDSTLPRKLHSLRRAIAKRLNDFDEYRFGKYNSKPHVVKLKALIQLAHPKPKDEVQAKLFKAVLDDAVAVPNTWEVAYSAATTDDEKRSVWIRLFESGNLPYMAMLRNLMNMCRVKVGLSFAASVGRHIADKNNVASLKQFPFRFYSAYKMLQNEGSQEAREFMPYVSSALEASIRSLEVLPGVTFMSADNSGSMESPVSSNSKMQCNEVANLFQAMLSKRLGSRAITSVFGDEFRIVNGDLSASAMTIAKQFQETDVGWSTNGHLAIEHLVREKVLVDRIIIFTDCQLWVDKSRQSEQEDNVYYGSANSPLFLTALKKYRQTVNKNVWVHWVNLAGYGTLPVAMSDERINVATGFSEQALRYFAAVEAGGDTMAKEIENSVI